jgi:transposase
MEEKMGGRDIYVGVDVSKERLDVALRPSGEFFSQANNERAVSRLVKRLQAVGCARVVVEATGGYETVVVAALWAAGVPVVMVNPRWTRAFAKSIGWLEKTDRIDACLLALYAERAELKPQALPDQATRELRELCARRADLQEMMEAERNRLEHASAAVRREITSHLDYLRKRLKRIDRDTDGAVRSSPCGGTRTNCSTASRAWARCCARPCWHGCPNCANSIGLKSPSWSESPRVERETLKRLAISSLYRALG